jgi:hypothetical protein
MMDFQQETVETLRQLTLQIMLVSAGVFGIVGGFVSATEKSFRNHVWLGVALVLFSFSVVFGYFLQGLLISQLNNQRFDPFDPMLNLMGLLQVGAFVVGGFCFTIFVLRNVTKK